MCARRWRWAAVHQGVRDLSGFSSYRALLDVIALLTMYATVLRPDAIVVKSGALKQFAAYCSAWRSRAAGDEPVPAAGA